MSRPATSGTPFAFVCAGIGSLHPAPADEEEWACPNCIAEATKKLSRRAQGPPDGRKVPVWRNLKFHYLHFIFLHIFSSYTYQVCSYYLYQPIHDNLIFLHIFTSYKYEVFFMLQKTVSSYKYMKYFLYINMKYFLHIFKYIIWRNIIVFMNNNMNNCSYYFRKIGIPANPNNPNPTSEIWSQVLLFIYAASSTLSSLYIKTHYQRWIVPLQVISMVNVLQILGSNPGWSMVNGL